MLAKGCVIAREERPPNVTGDIRHGLGIRHFAPAEATANWWTGLLFELRYDVRTQMLSALSDSEIAFADIFCEPYGIRDALDCYGCRPYIDAASREAVICYWLMCTSWGM